MTPEATIKMSSFTPNRSPPRPDKLLSGACLSSRMVGSINSIDFNACMYDYNQHSTMELKTPAHLGPLCLSHWSLNLDHPIIEPFIAIGILHWLTTTSSKELNREI